MEDSKLSQIKMNEVEKLNLKKMIKEQNVEDNTDNIRFLKHSDPIAKDILKIQVIKRDNPNLEQDKFTDLCIENCPFLYKNYTDIFNRMCRGELNLKMFSRFLFVLKEIEEGRCNVHEGSFMVGKLLKEIYIDSAIKKGENATENYPEPAAPTYVTPKNISWREYRYGGQTK